MAGIKVFIVDDSAVIRQVMGGILTQDKDIEVIGSAPDPILALRKMEKNWPDVIILDIHMPKMDGISFLKQIMSTRPTPVVICSAMTGDNPQLSLEALSSGAIEVINKPSTNLNDYLKSEEVGRVFNAIKAASKARVKQLKYIHGESYRTKHTADVILSTEKPVNNNHNNGSVIVIGASTGGTKAVADVLSGLKLDSPPIVVVQHMPPKFTHAFAERLNGLVALNVKEGEQGEKLLAGHVYIAPGGIHCMISSQNPFYYLELKDGPLVSRHKPSVDVLFRSAAQTAGAKAIGVLLTGMGDDGAQGMVELRQAGAYTLAQDEDSSLVYGMPKEAYERGGVTSMSSLSTIAFKIQKKMAKA